MKSLNEFDEFGDLTVKVISKNELDIKIADLENSIFDLKSHKLAEGVFQEDILWVDQVIRIWKPKVCKGPKLVILLPESMVSIIPHNSALAIKFSNVGYAIDVCKKNAFFLYPFKITKPLTQF